MEKGLERPLAWCKFPPAHTFPSCDMSVAIIEPAWQMANSRSDDYRTEKWLSQVGQKHGCEGQPSIPRILQSLSISLGKCDDGLQKKRASCSEFWCLANKCQSRQRGFKTFQNDVCPGVHPVRMKIAIENKCSATPPSALFFLFAIVFRISLFYSGLCLPLLCTHGGVCGCISPVMWEYAHQHMFLAAME